MKRLLFLICLLFLGLGFANVANAQDQAAAIGLSFDIEVGYDGQYKAADWIPVTVTIANQGPAIEGTLSVQQSVRLDDGIEYQTPVSLPTQSRKQVTLYYQSEDYFSVVEVALRDENGDLIAIASSKGGRLNRLNQDEFLWVVVADDEVALDRLEAVEVGGNDAGLGYIRPEQLPEKAVAWRSIDGLIFADFDGSKLSSAQRVALAKWLQGGGKLIFTGGIGAARTTATFDDLLPVTVGTSETKTAFPQLLQQVADLADDQKLDFRDTGPYLVTESTLKGGAMMLNEGGLPILSSREVGLGRVYFLALDPNLAPLLDWRGADAIWSLIAGEEVRRPLWAGGINQPWAASQAVRNLPDFQLPSPIGMTLFLLAYVIIVGPINYVVLNKKKKRERAWITIPAIILLFLGLSFVIGLRLKGNNTIINQLTVAYGSAESNFMQTSTAVGLYSPKRSKYEIVLNGDAVIQPFGGYYGGGFGGGGNSSYSGTIEQVGDKTIVNDVRVDVSGIETFLVTGYAEAPRIVGNVTLIVEGGEFKFDVDLHNTSDVDFENVHLMYGRIAVSIDDLAAGEHIQEAFSMKSSAGSHVSSTSAPYGGPVIYSSTGGSNAFPIEALAGGSRYAYGPGPATSVNWEIETRYSLLESLNADYYGPSGSSLVYLQPKSTLITLVGWSDEPTQDIRTNDIVADSRGMTVYFLEIPFTRLVNSAKDVELPPAFLGIEKVDIGSGYYEEPSITNFYLQEGEHIYQFEPLPPYDTLDISGLKIVLTTDGSSGDAPPQISIFDWETEKWVDLKGRKWGTQTANGFGAFFNEHNQIQIRLENDERYGINIESFYPLISGDLK